MPRLASHATVPSQRPVSAMNHNPRTREKPAADTPAGMKAGRKAMKKTLILGLNRLDSSPLR